MTETRTAETSGVTVRCGRQLQHPADVAGVGPEQLTVRSHRAPSPRSARAGGEDAIFSHASLAAQPIPAAAAGHLRRVSSHQPTPAGLALAGGFSGGRHGRWR